MMGPERLLERPSGQEVHELEAEKSQALPSFCEPTKQNTPLAKQNSNGWSPKEIRAAMVMAGLDARSIAERSGLSGAAISYAIRGLRQGLQARQAIAEALNISVTEIWPDALLPMKDRRLRNAS